MLVRALGRWRRETRAAEASAEKVRARLVCMNFPVRRKRGGVSTLEFPGESWEWAVGGGVERGMGVVEEEGWRMGGGGGVQTTGKGRGVLLTSHTLEPGKSVIDQLDN